jgi:hypothetical protein
MNVLLGHSPTYLSHSPATVAQPTQSLKKNRTNLQAVTASLHSSLPHGGEPMVSAAFW